MSGILNVLLADNAGSSATSTYNGVTNFSTTKLFSRTPGSSGSQRIFTFSCWIKRVGTASQAYFWMGDTGATTNSVILGFNSSDKFIIGFSGAVNSIVTTNSFASTTGWYHVTMAIDTGQATAANRVHLYVNDTEPSLSSSSYMAQNSDMRVNTSSFTVNQGGNPFASSNLIMAYPQFVDGTQGTYTDFNQSGGSGKVPKAYTGSFGTNGYAQTFSNTSSLGTDSSGNSNTLAVGSLTSGDASSQTVTF